MGFLCCGSDVRLHFLHISLQALIFFPNIQPIDFDGDATLFHFLLLKSVGKGAFGKVSFVSRRIRT